ncbi:WxL protein peptidoglycan domain-containing protein [Micromonospora sp. NPDC051925]|uniref:WxL protein peptidoglycan domain-containing protein n=1 Tax=Micromonospora sp. NPDC051925 TaxID=3364288 RepID=UPI0037CA43B8
MSLRTALSRTSVALATALLAVTLPPVPVHAAPTPPPGAGSSGQSGGNAGETGAARWAVQPSSAKGPTGRNYFIYDLAPGSTMTDHVGITNLGDRPLTFDVYGTDAYTSTDGAFALLPADQRATDVGSWISVDRRAWTVPPGKRVDIPFRLAVPANATPGDHTGGVIGAIARVRTTADGQRVLVDQRLAARVYLRVTGPVRPAVTVESVDVSYDNPVNPFGGGDLVVRYRLRNDGNVRVGGSGTVTVEGPFGGEQARTSPTDLPELLPGATFTVTERITGVPPLLRLTAEVDIAATTTDTALPPVVRTAGVWAPPWLLLALLAVAAGWAGLRWWRRRPTAAGPPTAPAPGGTLAGGRPADRIRIDGSTTAPPTAEPSTTEPSTAEPGTTAPGSTAPSGEAAGSAPHAHPRPGAGPTDAS